MVLQQKYANLSQVTLEEKQVDEVEDSEQETLHAF